VREQLRALGCDTAQGYHFSRPLPAADLAVWVGERAGAAAATARA
jgi:diguanylate cyclase